MEFASLADALLPAVLSAGRVVMSYFRQAPAVTAKAGGSPVTAADREAEAVLIRALSVAAPGIGIVAEEMMEGRAASAPGAEFFLVDPLDGTRGFIAGNDEFTVNIGLVRDRTPCFGMIYVPAQSRLFWTAGGETAVTAMVVPDATVSGLRDLDARAIRVRPVADGAPLTVTASRSHGKAALEAWLKRVDVAARIDVASSLKFCQVAAGEADVYPRLSPTSEWDTAAGHAILAAAGGVVTRADGAPLLYGKYEDSFVNPPFIAAARRMEGLFIVNAATDAGPDAPDAAEP